MEGKRVGMDVDFPESLGALIEHPGFMWYESGFENLDFLAKINRRITSDDVREAMRMVGLSPDLKKHVGKYSLGMKQRLGIAQAVMEKPNILILDEPMNGLDEDGVDMIHKLLLDYKQEGRVILLTSHQKEDIEKLCDTVYILRNGKII